MNRIVSALFRRKGAYIATFSNPSGEVVLADLAKFCRANETTYHPDPHIAARLDGRREVFLRIAHHLKLSQDALWRLYSGADLPENSTTEEA